MSDSKFIRGTIIVTLGMFITKVIGMIYVFPFERLVGAQGGALYSYGYIPYTIFLSIATMGVPLAVSKFVSKYNALGEYAVSRKMFRTGMTLMSMMGVVAFAVLYLLAPVFAPLVVGDNPHGNTMDDVTLVIRMVSFALILVPSMSLIRGFFQGHQSMGPTTVSQIIEQIVRIIFLLTGSYIVLRVANGTIAEAVSYATFAAFVGAIAGLAVLLYYWFSRRKHFNKMEEESQGTLQLSTREMLREIFVYAGPFVFVGLAIPLYQQIDTFTFNRTMESIGQGMIAEEAYAVFTMWGHKLVMIPVSLATAFSLTLVPAITTAYTSKNFDLVHKQVSQTLQMTFFLTLPAVIGMSVLSGAIYGAFYGVSDLGAELLRTYAPVALLYSLYSVTVAILQGLDLQRYAVVSLSVGVICKIALNVPLIKLFEANGAIIATAIGYTASILYTYYRIIQHTKRSYADLYQRIITIGIITAAMAFVVWLTTRLLSPWVSYHDGELASWIVVFFGCSFGIGTYFLLSYRFRLIQDILGDDLVIKIRRKIPFVKNR